MIIQRKFFQRCLFTITLLFVTIISLGTDFEKTAGTVQLEDGDTFVFIGNSITHQCLYTQYVEDYYYTRYPSKRIRFHNAGVSGDVAADVIRRFNDDIAEYSPKYASVLIGMNDGSYTPFEHDIFETYKKGMTGIVDSLQKIGTSPILITPTMFDLRPTLIHGGEFEPEVARTIHYNATLSFYGAWAYQMANEKGLGFINMFEPLNRITRENRIDDPEFTLIKDSVHPGDDGQVVMALAFLKDIGADPVVSAIHIDVQEESWEVLKSENGELNKIEDGLVQFQLTCASLPWVLPEDAALGYELTDAGTSMSRETIRITGLEKGKYELLIDGIAVGNYSYLDFSSGIELQENKLTPQYKQALKVTDLNKLRNEEAISPIRDLWLMKKIITAYNNATDKFEDEEEKKWLEEWLIEEFGSVDTKNFDDHFVSKLKPLTEESKKLEDKIYETNKPVTHTYEIIKK